MVDQDWDEQCRAAGLDPGEVRRVLDRYEAYRRYYKGAQRAAPLSLEDWFRYYRIEVATESSSQTPLADGCSIEHGATHRGAIRNPAAFLRMLAALEALRASQVSAR